MGVIMQNKIFISYRRDGGQYLAALLADHFTNKRYTTFLDVSSMGAGKFDEQIIENINSCTDFILVLSPGSLERCTNNDDWLRKEIECALENKKNIIPILVPGFSFPDKLPASIESIRLYQGVDAVPVYFAAMLGKIEEMLIANPTTQGSHSNFAIQPSNLFQMSYLFGKGVMGLPLMAAQNPETAQDKYEINEFKKAISYAQTLLKQYDTNNTGEEVKHILALCWDYINDPINFERNHASIMAKMLMGYNDIFETLFMVIMDKLTTKELAYARISCALGCLYKSFAAIVALKSDDNREILNNIVTFSSLVASEITGLPLPKAIIENAQNELSNLVSNISNPTLCLNKIEYLYNSIVSTL